MRGYQREINQVSRQRHDADRRSNLRLPTGASKMAGKAKSPCITKAKAMSANARPLRGRMMGYVVWVLALWAILLNLLNFNGYPIDTGEVALAFLGFGTIGAVLGVLTQELGPVLRHVLTPLFATIAIDLGFGIDPFHFLVVFAAFALISYFWYDLFLTVFFSASLSVIVFQAFGMAFADHGVDDRSNEATSTQRLEKGPADRPALIHVIFDSYLGLDGMALGPQYYRDLRKEQADFFIRQGFQVYPRAYSRHARTLNSLPTLFTYGAQKDSEFAAGVQYVAPAQLPYFADLDQRDYAISAVLPAYFDLCANQRMTRCRTFESSDLTSMLDTDLSTADRVKVFGYTILNLSQTVRMAVRVFEVLRNNRIENESRLMKDRSELFPLASLKMLDTFIDNLPTLRRGEARFAHILLPHDPYILRPDCTVKPESEWLDEHGPGATSARERAYADQVRCLQRKLGDLLNELDRTPAGREAIILFHGDHGSRIAPSQPIVDAPPLSPREEIMSFSTFYAIRIPGEASGEIPGTHALDELMADFRNRDFASAPRPPSTAPRAAYIDAMGTPKEWRELPSFEP